MQSQKNNYTMISAIPCTIDLISTEEVFNSILNNSNTALAVFRSKANDIPEYINRK